MSDPQAAPTLFDGEALEPAAPETSSRSAATGETLTPLRHLLSRLQSGESSKHVELHPRAHKLWVSREGHTYRLSVGRGVKELTFAGGALRQFAGLFDVSVGLLKRLSAIPKAEDTRLLNVLMWSAGGDPQFMLDFEVRGERIEAVHTDRYTPVRNLALAEAVQELESRGEVRVRRYHLDGSLLRLEMEYSALTAMDAGPGKDDPDYEADNWLPGAILVNDEEGGVALTVMPALIRDWGGLTLPVVPDDGWLMKHRHMDATPAELVERARRDLRASMKAPFQETMGRLSAFNSDFIHARGVHAHLSGFSLPFPTQQASSRVVARVSSGRPTMYRLMTASLSEARDLDRLDRRLRLELALGRLLWSRG